MKENLYEILISKVMLFLLLLFIVQSLLVYNMFLLLFFIVQSLLVYNIDKSYLIMREHLLTYIYEKLLNVGFCLNLQCVLLYFIYNVFQKHLLNSVFINRSSDSHQLENNMALNGSTKSKFV
jgi:hypothetical protein